MRALALTLALIALAAQTSLQKPSGNQRPSPQKRVIIYWNMARESVDFLLNRVPQSDPVRLAQLRQVFLDLQCRGSRLRVQPAPKGPNLLCTLPAEIPSEKTAAEPATILLLAHYEHEGSGQSAVENWSGAITLPFLYHALAAEPRHHNFVFAEVAGQSGAKALFESFTPAQRSNIDGVVALDALGVAPAQYYVNPNDDFSAYQTPYPVRVLLQAAADEHVPGPDPGIPGDWYKVDAVREFRHHGIPSIVIHSVDWTDRDLPGSAHDIASAIDHDAYCSTLTLLDVFMVELDNPWPSPGSDHPTSPASGRRH